jgi:hypothetical protein
MNEPHTADLGTRYRYREEGRKFEVERREAWLNRVRTWYPEKANIWMEGYETAETRIIKLLETLRCSENGVEHDCTDDLGGYSVNELIALIKGETK